MAGARGGGKCGQATEMETEVTGRTRRPYGPIWRATRTDLGLKGIPSPPPRCFHSGEETVLGKSSSRETREELTQSRQETVAWRAGVEVMMKGGWTRDMY